MMGGVFQFGEDVPGYPIRVLNEREIRASAGLLFSFMFAGILKVAFTGDFLLIKYAILVFLTDMLVRVLINPRYAPTLILGRLIVIRQTPEYVGAQQKRFAWLIGVALGLIMFTMLVAVNSFSPVTGLICITCLIFLFFETSFGICLGCLIYSWVYKGKAQYCPGEICAAKDRHSIQRVSMVQVLIVILFILYVLAIVLLFNDSLMRQPFHLFGFGPGHG